MTRLTQTTRTPQDFEYIVDDFDTEHRQQGYLGKVTIAGMVLLAHHYISKAGKIDCSLKENFKIHFPQLTPKEWYHVANEILDFYLGDDMNATYYKINLNKHNTIYKDWKKLNNKYNDIQV